MGMDNLDAVKLMLITNVSASILYYLHERAWNQVKFGCSDD